MSYSSSLNCHDSIVALKDKFTLLIVRYAMGSLYVWEIAWFSHGSFVKRKIRFMKAKLNNNVINCVHG